VRIPLDWLAEWVDIKESASRLGSLLTLAGVEVESIERVGWPAGRPAAAGVERRVIDAKVTSNRGDCLSIRGIAREIAARYAARQHRRVL